MSQFLVLSRRRLELFSDNDFERVLPAETERVRELYADGVVRQIWLRDDIPGAAFVIEADSRAAAEACVAELPMAATQLSEFTIVGLLPYRGFVG